jgi:hypothetical protein
MPRRLGVRYMSKRGKYGFRPASRGVSLRHTLAISLLWCSVVSVLSLPRAIADSSDAVAGEDRWRHFSNGVLKDVRMKLEASRLALAEPARTRVALRRARTRCRVWTGYVQSLFAVPSHGHLVLERDAGREGLHGRDRTGLGRAHGEWRADPDGPRCLIR